MQTMDDVDSELSSSADLMAAPTDTRGKHRVLAELKWVELEAKFLERLRKLLRRNLESFSFPKLEVQQLNQEELQKLESTEDVSTLCLELLHLFTTKPDPLLPMTTGPANPAWDRWFEPPKDPDGCRCWIL